MIEELLHVNPLDRAGIKHVKEHDLFNVLDWDSLLRQMAEFVFSLDLENTNVYVDGSCKYHRPRNEGLRGLEVLMGAVSIIGLGMRGSGDWRC